MSEDSNVIYKTSCPAPDCDSSDAFAVYDDDHGHCYSCGHHVTNVNGAEAPPTRKERRVGDLIEGTVKSLAKRGITEETCRVWNYRVGQYNGHWVQIAEYCNDQGQPVAQKLRFPDKEFTFIGEPKKAGLFGAHLWRDKGKKIVITEGEIDALTVSQLQGNKWPVVSVPNGAQGAAKTIRQHADWLEQFDQVIFMFDDDEPGREAAKECAALLSPGKAAIARIPGYKDANEAHQAGQGAKVIDAIWGAKEYRPDGVVSIDELFETAFTETATGIPWPWKALTEKTHGIRSKELYAFGGGVGCGKSEVFKEIAIHLNQLGHKVGYLAFEEPPGHSTKVIVGKMVGKRLHVPGVTAPKKDIDAAKKKLSGMFHFFDHFGAMDYETVKQRIRYMVIGLGCKHIFLDHLTALAASLDDERRGLDKMMADLSALTQQLDFTLYFISHLATPEGKPHEEGGRVMEKHFRGSRAIAQWSHFMFGIERDKQKPLAPTVFRALKDRFTGDANGLTFGLAYDRETGRLTECELPDANDPGFKDETGDTPTTDF
jgi:twinkle protein